MPSEPRPLRGDEAELFRLHFERLVRQVQRDAGVPEAVAEDCAGFAFLQLCRRQPERGPQLTGWLRIVARHEAFTWHRRARRFPSLEEGPTTSNGKIDGDRLPSPELVVAPVDVELVVEAREALRALAALKQRQRETLALKVAGYSYREIQALRGVTYTNVNRHVNEGRAAVRKLRDAA
jgi:RNA polymerase sigma factor (sigma-70 family)